MGIILILCLILTGCTSDINSQPLTENKQVKEILPNEKWIGLVSYNPNHKQIYIYQSGDTLPSIVFDVKRRR